MCGLLQLVRWYGLISKKENTNAHVMSVGLQLLRSGLSVHLANKTGLNRFTSFIRLVSRGERTKGDNILT